MQTQTTHNTERRLDLTPAGIDALVARIRDYDYDKRRTALVALETLINSTHGDRAARLRIETAMGAMLESNATVAAKQFICKKLWIVGTDVSAPALEKLLEHPDLVLAEAACYALRTQPSPAASRALRGALDKTRGKALVAVINLLGDRRDAMSSTKLIELTWSPDAIVADAAIAALGKIASPDAVSALSSLHGGADRERRRLSAHALLQGAQELAKRGDIKAAQTVYRKLTDPSEESNIRRGATLALRSLA